MQLKDIVVGKWYAVNGSVALVLDKGKLDTDYNPNYSHTFDVGGVVKQTLSQRWYRHVRDRDQRANNVAVWIPDYGRVEVVITRHVKRALTAEEVVRWVSERQAREEVQRIENEEATRIQNDQTTIASALALLVDKDPTTLSSWDLRNPWRLITENESFVKKAVMAYLTILSVKGEQVGGADAADLIEEIRAATTAVNGAKQRREARITAATTTAQAQVATTGVKVVITDTSVKETVNA